MANFAGTCTSDNKGLLLLLLLLQCVLWKERISTIAKPVTVQVLNALSLWMRKSSLNEKDPHNSMPQEHNDSCKRYGIMKPIPGGFILHLLHLQTNGRTGPVITSTRN